MRLRRLLVLSLVGASACRFGGAGEGNDEALPMATAERGEFRVSIEEVGVLRASVAQEVKAQRWGRVSKVLDDGAKVNAGDPVLWFDTKDLEQYVRVLDAELAESQGESEKHLERMAFQERSASFDIAVSEANLDFEKKKLLLARKSDADARRRRELGLISQAAADAEAERLRGSELSAEKARLAHARKLEEIESRRRGIEVERQKAAQQSQQVAERREWVQKELDASILVSPTAGEVFLPKQRFRGQGPERGAGAGDQVGPWMGTLVQIPDRSKLEVRSQADEALIGSVIDGLPVEIRATAIEGLRLRGKVRSSAILAVPRSRSEGAGFSDDKKVTVEKIVFPIIIDVEGSDPRLQPGMTVSVSYLLSVLPDAVSVPDDTVFGSAEAPIVFVFAGDAGDQDFEVRPVRLGPASGGRVVVTEGLAAGEKISRGDPRSDARS
jgi:multidrug resistance efflux pump